MSARPHAYTAQDWRLRMGQVQVLQPAGALSHLIDLVVVLEDRVVELERQVAELTFRAGGPSGDDDDGESGCA